MSVQLTINGQTFEYPEQGDNNWGPDATEWAQSVTIGMLQKAGGLFQLLDEVDFGASYGIKAFYIKSRSSNVASSGSLRLSNTDSIAFRDASNTNDLLLGVNGSDQLTYNGVAIVTGSYISGVSDTSTIDLQVTGTTLSASIVALSINNAQIGSSAQIQFSKMESLNTNIVPVTNGSGSLVSSSVTSTELGRLSGVTSSIQTQLNDKLNLSGGTLTGTLTLNADPSLPLQAATKQYVDNSIQGLKAKQAVVCATTANITLSGEQTIDGVLTSSSRILVKNQSAPAQNGIYVTAAGAWSRSSDADTWDELVSAYVFISQGATQADTGWVCTVDAGGTLGTTAVTWVQFSAAGIILAGSGLTKTGNTLSVNVDNSTIEINSNNLRIKPLGVTNAEISASAAISYSKLSIADGDLTIAKTNGLQTALDGKLPTTITTTGDVIYSSSGTTASRLPIGSTGQVLTVAAGIPSWATPTPPNPTVVSVTTTPITLTAADSGKVYLVSTAAARTINLPAPAAGLIFYFKDSTGQAQTNNITLVRNGGTGSIEGVAASKILQTNWGSWTLVSDGTNWFML